ncbi:hypothetical protein EJ05DRAFT_289035 [Pseudovirgaria hyperparasitica]|uniref:Uncharacterized protein n=1 Tax=Pseudovirgaria hyperparasitica TaxID=470096 RepID=A0A6A6WCK3_9PEZI|nr:uncharacterized protein EJ05DRAFT_289035 [Pseudovirgaria hyperparasitica]KAF2760558.1 hypothetical protein EJ05DRAFT_289035 [Pseudovirgaria hyperparasitica]
MQTLCNHPRRLIAQNVTQLARTISILPYPVLRPSTLTTRTLRRTQDLRYRSTGAQTSENLDLSDIDITGRPDLGFYKPIRQLPVFCPGCGAPTQATDSKAAGFYNTRRHRLKQYLYGTNPEKKKPFSEKRAREDDIFEAALKQANQNVVGELAALSKNDDVQKRLKSLTQAQGIPVCDRCHHLTHHNSGESIYHPSIESIEEIIATSPHKYNHIYHIVDAADFPMSLIPNLQHTLDLSPLRSQNRRSKDRTFRHGRVAEVSFIITRADLLAAKKEDVDRLMPWALEVLRTALGRTAKNARLGNVRLVSASRGWWTPEVKEEIWDRGGAGWMVGKANVGKSKLFQVVYPKGRSTGSHVAMDKVRREAQLQITMNGSKNHSDTSVAADLAAPDLSTFGKSSSEDGQDAHGERQISENMLETCSDSSVPGSSLVSEISNTDEPAVDPFSATSFFDPDSLLPPPQIETQYPIMPMASSLPGTTAAPIRIPFGGGKGELIDLPGLLRSDIDTYIEPEHRSGIIMTTRQIPEKIVIKPGQSLVLGGLIRITPKNPDLVFIAHPFLTLEPHLTSTEKAIQLHERRSTLKVPTITTESAGEAMRSAGTFPLTWDVTSKQTGTLTARDAGRVKIHQLPFIVYSTDIVVEGIGWVEVTCQVRKRHLEETQEIRSQPRETSIDDSGPIIDAKIDALPSDNPLDGENTLDHSSQAPASPFPEIEVFSPLGKYIATRRTMNGSVVGGKLPIPKHLQKARPRQNMKRVKRSLRANKSSIMNIPQ